jgi:hydrogenase/urease accessory protein HupE
LVLPAAAHEMTMVDLHLREVGPGDFLWAWGTPAKGRPVAEDLSVVWPEQCQVLQQAVHCGAKGLTGPLVVKGVGKAYSAVILRLTWKSGQTQVFTLTEAQPKVMLLGSERDQRGSGEIAHTYGLLGVEHILTGWDHLLFVISLLVLVGFRRPLVYTITAFTAAHSLTLACSALGWISLRSAPVEACIALSILLVSSEALRKRPTWARQWPALVAFVFGMVHGLGFAGALQEIGLPEQHLVTALLSFNLGVEAGQLAVVLVCWAGCVLLFKGLQGLRLQRTDEWLTRGKTAVVYTMGSMAAFWTLERVTQIISG